MPLFPVPKFTEMETRIVGPLTFKQFIFILSTVGACFIIYHMVPKFLSIPLLVAVGVFGFALAFFKIGDIPFYQVFFEWLTFFFQPKRLLWGRKGKGEFFSFEEMELKKEEKNKVKLKKESKLKETLVKIETKK